MNNKCLNCEKETQGNYCSNCGQSTSIHRFSLKHFFVHDFVHGIFHFDKGFIFTIRELFTQPGHSIREYIQGKRVKYFNCFSTIILVLTIEYFFLKLFHVDAKVFLTDYTGLYKFQKDYSKFVPFIAIPFYALCSYLIFRKSQQNYTENLVLNTYLVGGWMLINFIQKVALTFAPTIFLNPIKYITIAVTVFYIYVFYYQYFSVFKFKLPLFIKVIFITLSILTIKQFINVTLNNIGLHFLH